MAISCIVDSCLLVPPICPTAPPYLFDPALPSSTLGKSTSLPAYLKDIISNPNQPRHHGITPFTPFFWVVGNTQCGLIIWFRQVLSIHISGWHIQVHFPKMEGARSIIQSCMLVSTHSHPPIFKIMVQYIFIHVLYYKYSFTLSKTAPK